MRADRVVAHHPVTVITHDDERNRAKFDEFWLSPSDYYKACTSRNRYRHWFGRITDQKTGRTYYMSAARCTGLDCYCCLHVDELAPELESFGVNDGKECLLLSQADATKLCEPQSGVVVVMDHSTEQYCLVMAETAQCLGAGCQADGVTAHCKCTWTLVARFLPGGKSEART